MAPAGGLAPGDRRRHLVDPAVPPPPQRRTRRARTRRATRTHPGFFNHLGDDVVVGRGSLVETTPPSERSPRSRPTPTSPPATGTLEEHVFIAPCAVTTNDNFMGRTERRHELIEGTDDQARGTNRWWRDPLPGNRDRRGGLRGCRRGGDRGRSRRRRRSSATLPRKIRDVPDEERLAVTAYETARLEDLRREDGWAPIRLTLDVQAFGVNAWTGSRSRRRRDPGARRGSDRPRGALRRRHRTRDLHGRRRRGRRPRRHDRLRPRPGGETSRGRP